MHVQGFFISFPNIDKGEMKRQRDKNIEDQKESESE